VRRLAAGGAGLDGLEAEVAGLEVGHDPAPAAEGAAGLGKPAVTVALPGLDQHVPDRRAGAVEDAALDRDALPGGAFGGDLAAEDVVEDVEAGRAFGARPMWT
jgi:hypothetical protein